MSDEMSDEMSGDFRGVLADVIDGQVWAGYAGPGAAVRERGERRRRRLAASSVLGVAAVAAVAVAGSGLVAGRTAPASADGTAAVHAPSSTATSTGSGGPYVKLDDAFLHPGDLGTGYGTSLLSQTSTGPFPAGLLCGGSLTPVATVSPVGMDFTDGVSEGTRLQVVEALDQLPDAASAERGFQELRQQSAARQCRDGNFRDVPGVGDGMFVQWAHQQGPDGGHGILYAVNVRVGAVTANCFIDADQAVTLLPDSWLDALGAKMAARVQAVPHGDMVGTVPSPSSSGSLPVSQPVDGFLFAPSDLGSSFQAGQSDAWQDKKPIPSAQSVSGMTFRGTVTGGDGEFLVNEGVSRFADASAAQTGLDAYAESAYPAKAGTEPLTGLGDRAWIKRWPSKGGLTVAIQAGDKVITFDVLAGGTSADQPIPGGDAWVQQIAHAAVRRLAAAK
jgi:hypothetical protein